MTAHRTGRNRRNVAGQLQRRPSLERLEIRTLLAADLDAMQAMLAMDIDGDLYISPSDVLGVVNQLNLDGARDLGASGEQNPEVRRLHRLDADRDGHVAANDAVRVINKLNLDGPQDLRLRKIAEVQLHDLSLTQQDNLEELFAHVNKLRMDCNVTPENVVRFVHALKELAHSATPPSTESVHQLVEDLTATSSDGELSTEEITVLEGDLTKVLESAHVTPEAIQQIVTNFRAIVEASEISKDEVRRIAMDIKRILVEFNTHQEHETQLVAAKNLLLDVAAIRGGEPVTPALLEDLSQDFSAAVGRDHVPNGELLAALVRHYVDATADHQWTDTELNGVSREFHAVLDSAHVTPPIWERVLTNIREVVGQAGDDSPLAAAARDLKILSEVRESGGADEEARRAHLAAVRNLLQDVAAIRGGEPITPERLADLSQDFTAVVGEEHVPNAELVAKLVGDFVLANSDHELSESELVRLSREFHAVLDSARVTPRLWGAVLADVREVAAHAGDDRALRGAAEILGLLSQVHDNTGSDGDAHRVRLEQIKKLLQDVSDIRRGEPVTPARLETLSHDFKVVAGEGHVPDAELFSQLIAEYDLATDDRRILEEEAKNLSHDLYVVLDSAHITPQVWDAALADVHEVLEHVGADNPLRVVGEDLRRFAEIHRRAQG